jgi:RNA polymerase sigma-70 factor (ECF subfamily)
MGAGGALNDGGTTRDATRAVVYCLLPRDLAPKLHEPLRRCYRDDPSVSVVVERRRDERRNGERRRTAQADPPAERRKIHNVAGRRVAERRSTVVEIAARKLPRQARAHADRLVFVERLEPSTEEREDADSARLVTRFQAGDRDVFADLYRRYFDRVYAYLRVVFGSQHDAEDAAQHVFVKAFEALERYEQRQRSFGGWLFTIVRHHAVDELRRGSRSEPVDPAELADDENGADALGDTGLDRLSWIVDPELLLFVERLPLAHRQVLFRRVVLDLPSREVARILGRSDDDVRMLQSRALRRLRTRLSDSGRAPSDRRRASMRAPLRQAKVLRARRSALYYGLGRGGRLG